MATSKKRASGSATISKTAIEQVGSRLKDLPEKPKENLSLREAISELHESITTALNRGYSYDEVVKILATQKVSITVASLKRYLAAARKEVAEKPRRARRTTTRSRETQLAKQAEALSTAAALANTQNGAAPSIEATETAPKKRTRTSSTRSKASAKTAAKPAEKTKTAAKAKPTSRAKTTSRSTSRSTSSRSRRKSGGASE